MIPRSLTRTSRQTEAVVTFHLVTAALGRTQQQGGKKERLECRGR